MRKKGLPNICCPWLLKGVSVLFLLWTEANGEEVQIRPESNYCHKNDTLKLVHCNLQNENGRMLEMKWTDLQSFEITNGNSLIILPQCEAKGKQLRISNTRNIHSQPMALHKAHSTEHCQVGLSLVNCTATKLDHLFNLVTARQTSIDTVKLTVEKIRLLDNCYIGDFDIVSTSEMAIENSKVDSVTKLEMQGVLKLEIFQSHINAVRKLIYNSSHEESVIRHTTIKKVFADGFEMVQGSLSLEDVTFTYLPSESIVIYGGAIDLINVRIEEAYSKSIIMKGPGTMTFRNLTVGDYCTGQSFLIENKGNQVLWPLAIIVTHSMALSLPVGITIGFVIGIFLTIILVFIIHSKCKNKVFVFGSKKQYLSPMGSHQSPEENLVQPTQDRQCKSSSNVQKMSDVMEDDYNDVQPESPITYSMMPFFSKPESVDMNSSSVSAKPHVPPLPAQLLQTKGDSELKAPYDFHEKTCSSEVTDDDDLIYENCEDYMEPNHIIKPPNNQLPPVRKQHPLSNEKISVSSSPAGNEDPTGDPSRGYQNPLISEQINAKSFLHHTKKPPAPPKPTVTKDTSVKPPVSPTRKVPGKLPIHEIRSRFGQLPFPKKSSTTANQNEDSDEIYEDIS